VALPTHRIDELERSRRRVEVAGYGRRQLEPLSHERSEQGDDTNLGFDVCVLRRRKRSVPGLELDACHRGDTVPGHRIPLPHDT
jgi:hypothetical protein